MYEELFHSVDRPFRATPDPKFYYPHESIETARQTAVRAVLRAEGPVMVLGGAGLGKSLLGMVIANDLSARFDVVKLHAARLCSRRALLQNILFELQLPYRDLSEGELRFSILDRLEPSSENAPDGILVVVDEAHTLPVKLLDELRIITNFTRNNQPRARLVLIGNLRLEHTFAEPQMESFNQRLAARCYLQPMNRQQTYAYIKHQLQIAGVNPRELITEDAVNTVYAASEGVPRLSNQIMDHALVLAITRAQCPVSSALIEEAWSDLQQLPAPWHSGAEKFGTNATGQTTAVEFGSLDDEDDDLNQELQLDTSSVQIAQSSEPVRSGGDEYDYRLAPEENELGFADEQPSAPPERINYFTAFAPADDEFSIALDLTEDLRIAEEPAADQASMPTANAGGVGDLQDLEGPQLVRPRVFFDAPDNIDYSTIALSAAAPADLSIDSFFANRPTDELLLAFQDEQDQFDSMGVWENDPPLTAIAPGTHRDAGDRLVEKADFANIFGKSETIQPADAPSSLFGDDFDEEIPVSPKLASLDVAANPRQAPVGDAPQLDATTHAAMSEEDDTSEYPQPAAAGDAEGYSARQAAEAADYVARIQEYADALRRANQQTSQAPLPTVEEVLSQVQTPLDIASKQVPETWSFDVASLDVRNEVAVHNEIEDLVSQLNFAAFATEPYSVEQISLEPQDQREVSPPDTVRYGQNEEIYTLHRPQESAEQRDFNGWTVDESSPGDDDRDLLIVEEDLPPSAKVVNEIETPVTKIAPYSQLFAKLRK